MSDAIGRILAYVSSVGNGVVIQARKSAEAEEAGGMLWRVDRYSFTIYTFMLS